MGGIGSLNTDAPVKTVGSYWPYATTLYDYIHRAMPADKPQSLQPDEVYALCAYLLYLNGIVPEDAVMDAKTLPHVVMPNHAGFTSPIRGRMSSTPRPPDDDHHHHPGTGAVGSLPDLSRRGRPMRDARRTARPLPGASCGRQSGGVYLHQ